MPLEIVSEKGVITITPATVSVKLQKKGRLVVGIPVQNTPRLSPDTIEQVRNALRKQRSGVSP
jgi:hypothetical protein